MVQTENLLVPVPVMVRERQLQKRLILLDAAAASECQLQKRLDLVGQKNPSRTYLYHLA